MRGNTARDEGMAGFAWLAVLKAEFSTLPEPELSTLPRHCKQRCASGFDSVISLRGAQ
jgi:hypothetical protein